MPLARHPPLLRVLVITEVGERFGGYLVLALLTVYLTEQLGWSAAGALRANGVFLALCYGLSLPAGLWADRARAHASAVAMGCVFMAGGYLFLVLGSTRACLVGLALLSVGGGLFKPSILALLGDLYAPEDPRREEGFAVFYASVNLGALFAPPIGEWLRRNHGWSAAFGIAALVQLATTAYFSRAWSALRRRARESTPPPATARSEGNSRLATDSNDRRRIRALLFLAAITLWFWVALQQTGGTLTLFARDQANRHVNIPLPTGWKDWEVPIGWLASLHAGLVIVLSPVVAMLWAWRQRLGRAVSDPAQMAIGMALLAVAYGCLVLPLYSSPLSRVGFGWLLACYTALSLAEICVAPLGYSLVCRLAPAGYAGLLLGTWLLVMSVGSFLAGELGARLWLRWTPQHFFGWLAAGSAVVGLALAGMQRCRKLGTFGESTLRTNR